MRKIIGTAAGILVLFSALAPASPSLSASSWDWPKGQIEASSWDWPK